MRKCDIKTLQEALGAMWAFVCWEGRQYQITAARELMKENGAPAVDVEYAGRGYTLQEHVEVKLAALILKLDAGYEFHIEPWTDARAVLHRHHFLQYVHAVREGLITKDEPPPGSKRVAIVKPGEWHDFRGQASDWYTFCKDLDWPILFMQSLDDDLVAQAAWWLLKDKKAALDVEEWFFSYCKTLDRTAELLNGSFKAPVSQEAIPHYLSTMKSVETKISKRAILGLDNPIGDAEGKEFVPTFMDPDSARPFEEVEATVDGDEYEPPPQEWPSPKPSPRKGRAYKENWPEGELRSTNKVAKLIGKPESTIRDAIKAWEIECEIIGGIEKRKGYIVYGRMHYGFTKAQADEAMRYFDKKNRDKALRLLIIRDYRKKRGVGEDAARQWVYRKTKENPSLTLEDLKSQVDKMKKGKGSK
jgi:hypothetical protein